MTSVPTIYPGIHSNAHSSCMANELHGAEKKRKDTETQKKWKEHCQRTKSQKRTHTQNHNLQLPCVFCPCALFPSASSSTTFHSYHIQASGCLRAQRKSHRHADSSLFSLPTLSLLFLFAPVVFQVTPWHKMEKVIENDLKSKAFSVANDCHQVVSF